MTEETLKPLHYGETAKLLDATMDRVRLSYADPQSDIRQTETLRELRRTLASEIERMYVAVQSQPDFYDTVSFLEASQEQRHRDDPRRWSSYDGTITAGIQTALNTTENIHDSLSPVFSTDLLNHPNSSGISRHIARMHNRQFTAFRDTYLQSMPGGKPSVLPLQDLLDTRSDGSSRWIAFKPQYPDEAPVPKRFVDLQGMPILFDHDITIDDLSTEPMVAIKDIILPAGSPQIGCPFTFTPDQMKAFWDIYCTQRSRIEQKLALGRGAVSDSYRIGN